MSVEGSEENIPSEPIQEETQSGAENVEGEDDQGIGGPSGGQRSDD